MGPQPQDRYQRLEKVGEGSCGVVFKCRDRETDGVVAIKKIRFSYEANDGSQEAELGGDWADAHIGAAHLFGAPSAALREVAALQTLQGHPNVVRLQEAFVDNGARMYLVCEFLERDLRRHMDELGPLPHRRCKLYSWQLLRGLAHCHASRVVHRDVKPQNILVDVHTDTLKLCDFSLARALISSSAGLTRRVASLWYRSPELLLGSACSGPPLDMWSTGCVLGEMLLHAPVFPGGSEIETLLLHFNLLGTPGEGSWPGVSSLPHWSGAFPRFKAPVAPSGLSSVAAGDSLAARVLAALLCCNPAARQSAETVLAAAWFLDLDCTSQVGCRSLARAAAHR